MPDQRSVRIGLHARNDYAFAEGDYLVIREARIETIKMLSFTQNSVFERLRNENPDLEFIVRLHDQRVGMTHPSPDAFVQTASARINELKSFAIKFEILNEPNHNEGYEGWGSSDADAQSFRDWYLEVLSQLRLAYPWAQFGFPGLAPNWPHRDMEWLEICREAVQASDWLGCHAYWQQDNQLKNDWGLRFKAYHERFPDKVIEITEFGNSTPNLSGDVMAAQYAMFYQELCKYPYIGSACAFIASSPDPQWDHFVWRKESDEFRPMVRTTGNIPRPQLVAPQVSEPAPPYKVDWLEYTPPAEIAAGQLTTAGIRLRNAGSKVWDSTRVHIGYHWSAPTGEPVQAAQDIRTRLPADMAPGVILTLNQIQLSAPPFPGDFTLKWDLVDGDSTWFSLKGSPTFDIAVTVKPLAFGEGLYCEETLCTISQPFLDLYRRLGVETCGYPVTDAFLEQGIPTQYFENVAMEQLPGGAVQLKPVGRAAYEARARTAALEERLNYLEAETSRLQDLVDALMPENGMIVAQIEDISASLPKHQTETYDTRALSEIKNLILHHTAVSPDVGPQAIARYHVDKQGWPGIGYHYFITVDGTIYQTNQLQTISYHVRHNNPASVGIALAGNLMEVGPTPKQLESASRLLVYLIQRLGLTADSVKGHRDLVATACPGDQWEAGLVWRDDLLQRITAALGES